jgi:ferredoxin
MRIKLDRTLCDGFGLCAAHAPETFSLDDWGYASLVEKSGEVPAGQQADVTRALLDCPVHAILLLRTGAPTATPEMETARSE